MAIDQHARSATIAGLDLSSGETKMTRLVNCPSALDIASWATSWATKPVRFVYESGPCGFQLARDLKDMGYDCDVIAVTTIPRSLEDKQFKDDKRDAHRLLDAVVSPNSKCKPVVIPSEAAEAARDLVRSYFDMVASTKRLKMQFSGMLLRHGFVWNEKTPAGNLKATWTNQYLSWVKSIKLSQKASNATLEFYLVSVLSSLNRCSEVKNACLKLALSERFKPYVDALSRLKGVDDITAFTYVVTMDDFDRFKNGRSVSSYFGLTPTRSDSGQKTRRSGSVSKAGDTTVRRAVIEGLASMSNFNNAPKGQRKGREVSAIIEAEAIKCNIRNRNRYHHLVDCGKKPNVAKVAVVSEMVREMWVLGRMVQVELVKG
jgi:hypothetical protein